MEPTAKPAGPLLPKPWASDIIDMVPTERPPGLGGRDPVWKPGGKAPPCRLPASGTPGLPGPLQACWEKWEGLWGTLSRLPKLWRSGRPGLQSRVPRPGLAVPAVQCKGGEQSSNANEPPIAECWWCPSLNGSTD
mmetsp:Transcript_65010/g.125510  ORF Transcript_65010/g.125510 Transcript_65010/m.125510 type:complete len:135 (+) Transcript_65010:1088-1492(+)